MSVSSPSLVSRLFGPFVLLIDGEPIPRLHTRKGQWLFALLALRHGRDVERSWLAGTLWPDSREEQARASLRMSLTDLRRALGTEAYRIVSPTSRTLRLNLSETEIDLIDFDEAIRRGDPASLEAAVSLYRGPMLEGCFEEWVVRERADREKACLDALETLAGVARNRGDHATAILHLQKTIGLDPLRETAQRSLMEAQAALGNYGEVTQVYRQYRELLRQELQAEPSPESTRLFQKFREEARGHAQAKTPAQRPSFLSPPRHLPRPATLLLGRDQEIERIRECLVVSRLVTLTGCGGVGKTRLSIAVAESIADEYPDGVWFIDLTGLSDPAFLAQTVAQALGLREEAHQEIIQTLIDYLRSKSLMLILDNCEHLLESCGRLTSSLLESSPSLKILAASREALHLRGEQEIPVPSLSLPDPEQRPSLERLAASDAVRLFVHRACEVNPHFSVTEENASAIAAICQQLEGLPLAIELAAARTRLLSPPALLSRLASRLKLLTGGPRDLPARQQTLRGTIDWSYDLLNEEEKALFGRLSVFAGGGTIEAVEAVCDREGEIDVLDRLLSLAGKSLLRRVESGGEDRFGMFEMIREYASERLASNGELALLEASHTDYFLALAESADAQIYGQGQKAALERLKADRENLTRVLDRCIGSEKDREAGLRLVASLHGFWNLGGHFTEGRIWSERVLAVTSGETLVRARVLNGAGYMAVCQGDCPMASVQAEESLKIGRNLGDLRTIADALHTLGCTADYQNQPSASALYEEALSLYRQIDHPWGIASILVLLVNRAMERGLMKDLDPMLQESLRIGRELGERQIIARVLLLQGRHAMFRGESEAAIARFHEGFAVAEEIGERWSIAVILLNLGMLSRAEGKPELERHRYRKALTIFRELKDQRFMRFTLLEWATVESGEAGVRLYGAVEIACEANGVPMPPIRESSAYRTVEDLRSSLGEIAFNAAWKQGRGMTLDEAVDFALMHPLP